MLFYFTDDETLRLALRGRIIGDSNGWILHIHGDEYLEGLIPLIEVDLCYAFPAFSSHRIRDPGEEEHHELANEPLTSMVKSLLREGSSSQGMSGDS